MTDGNPAHIQRGLGANGAIGRPEVRRFPRSASHALMGHSTKKEIPVSFPERMRIYPPPAGLPASDWLIRHESGKRHSLADIPANFMALKCYT